MIPDRDPFDVLASLAPPVAGPDRLASAYARTMALRSAPPRRRWTVRGSVVGVAVIAFSTGGIGLATADDPVPSQITDLFALQPVVGGSAQDGAGPDPSSIEYVTSVPFDDEHRFSLWASTGSGGTTCHATVVEPTSGGDWTRSGGGSLICAAGPEKLALLATATSEGMPSHVDDGLTFFVLAGGDSVRATVRLADGSDRELLAGGGHYFGWVPEGVTTAVVTAYGADGAATDTVTVPG
ncbi:hypothetical protein [Sanguibacter antarcticus]|uniref:Uncharacterized protein n=1 Tax=Sanguibacter antarcticus TaxID=372484 RepID=A0A2A9E197_9MICO|nr:hypothetical protein [Sanguibacter antarcticus]PFG32341.1 hypothetical protein ATL42_0165 [Sanguibacter antarcticus]